MANIFGKSTTPSVKAIPSKGHILALVKVQAKKSNTIKSALASILGTEDRGPTDLDKKVEAELKLIADQEDGEYDDEDGCVIFDSEANALELRVYAFVEDNLDGDESLPDQYVVYQAIARYFSPNRFVCGEVTSDFREAVDSLKVRMK